MGRKAIQGDLTRSRERMKCKAGLCPAAASIVALLFHPVEPMRKLIPLLALIPMVAHASDPHAEAKAIIGAQCASCHNVPGVPAAVGDIGPSLKGIGARPLIAGKLPNVPDNMVRWLMHPQQVSPESAMPDLGLSQDQARRIAAYLATLDQK